MPISEPSFKPTLFLVVGDMGASDYQTLKDVTMERLDCAYTMEKIGQDRLIPVEGIGWDFIRRMDDLDDRRLDIALSQVLDTKYFQIWRQKGILPIVEGQPITVQVVVIYHFTHPESANQPLQPLRKDLEAIYQKLNDYFENRAFNLTLALLMLDNTENAMIATGMDARNLGYYPRFLMQRIDCFGLKISHEGFLQEASTLLVAIASSNIVETIQSPDLKIPSPNRLSWLVVGAAAVTSRMARMRAYFRYRLFNHLMEPLLVSPPTHDQETFLNGVAEKFIRGEEQDGTRIGLNLKLQRQLGKLREWKNDRRAGNVVQKTRMGTNPQFIGLKKKAISEELQEYYLEFEKTAILETRDSILAYKEEMFRLVRAVLLPSRATRMPSQVPGHLSGDDPHGLGAATHLLKSTVALISAVPSPQPEGLYMAGDDALVSIAKEDGLHILRQHVAMHRSKRSILSFGMAIAFAFPVVPMLARALQSIARMTPLVAFLIALGTTSILVAVELFYWISRLRREATQRQDASEQRVEASLKKLGNRVHAEGIRASAVPLNDLLYSLGQLTMKLELAYRDSTIEQTSIEQTLADISGDQGAIYWLHDLRRCKDWSNQALRELDQRETLLPDLLDGILHGKITSQSVLNEIVKMIENQYKNIFNMTIVQPLPIISADSTLVELRDGKHLTWLDQRSAPLGHVITESQKVKFLVAFPEWLTGGIGDGNPNWPKGKVVSLGTLQPNEIICIQMFAMVNED